MRTPASPVDAKGTIIIAVVATSVGCDGLGARQVDDGTAGRVSARAAQSVMAVGDSESRGCARGGWRRCNGAIDALEGRIVASPRLQIMRAVIRGDP